VWWRRRHADAVGDVTFWQDVAPIYNDKCVRCHQEGGIAPFRLDTYEDAKANAALEKQRTAEGTMPPYFMVHDGSCQQFVDDTTLNDHQKAVIAAWVDQSTPEGTPVTLTLPPQPALAAPSTSRRRCSRPSRRADRRRSSTSIAASRWTRRWAANSFLTAYAVTPGDASIVHHVITFVVDPTAAGDDGRNERRDHAGAGRRITRAPGLAVLRRRGRQRERLRGAGDVGAGQGIVEYPPAWASRSRRPTSWSSRSTTTSRTRVGRQDRQHRRALALRDSVSRELAFSLPDGLLDTLGGRRRTRCRRGRRTPRTRGCAAGATWASRAARPSIWWASCRTCTGRGIRQKMTIGGACASHLENWDFHWQEFYFYETPREADGVVAGAGHVRVRHERGTRSRSSRLGHAQRDVPQRADGRAAAAVTRGQKQKNREKRRNRGTETEKDLVRIRIRNHEFPPFLRSSVPPCFSALLCSAHGASAPAIAAGSPAIVTARCLAHPRSNARASAPRTATTYDA
jgi:hypothetical protein